MAPHASERARILWIEPAAASSSRVLRPEALGLDPAALSWISSLEALEAALRRPAIRLCVLVAPPDGLSEAELLSKLQARDPNLPVLVASTPELEARRRVELEKSALRALAAGAAHDLNNMLGVIASYATLLADELPAGEDRRDDAAQILGACERARATTEQLLAFSRLRPVLPEVIDLSARLEMRRPSLQRHLGETVTFETTLEPGLMAFLDPSQFDDALLQLILNANDAMPRGGELRLEARSRRVEGARDCSAGRLTPGDFLEIALVDGGAGMSPDVCARIFEPFFSHARGGKGLGLGLNVVQAFAEGNGGAVDVVSRPGEGTRVHLYLPAFKPELTPAE